MVAPVPRIGARSRILGVRRRRGLIDLDPRTLMGVLAATSAVAFVGKSFEIELALVLAVAALQVLCGYMRMALGFAAFYAALWVALNVLFPSIGGVAATMFTISFTFCRKIYLCLMVGTLLVSDNSVHRITTALGKLRVPQEVLIPLTVTMRYFPTLAEEASHIRDAMVLRDIPVESRLECFVVPLVMSATSTAEELSRAATCRGIENPAPSTDTERLSLGLTDYAVLASAALSALVVIAWGGAA